MSGGEARVALGNVVCEESGWGMEWRRTREWGGDEGGVGWCSV